VKQALDLTIVQLSQHAANVSKGGATRTRASAPRSRGPRLPIAQSLRPRGSDAQRRSRRLLPASRASRPFALARVVLAFVAMMKPNILVPFDFSDNAAQALAWATQLQTALQNQGPIQVIHFISSYPSRDPMSIMQVLLPNAEEITTLENALREAVAKAGAWAEVEVVVRPLAIGESIVARADELHADLIVMGTHGRTGVKRMVLGSVADHVVRHAPCPVLTMRERPASQPR
jgi:nucleotide-binding universal stress UspA family protein